MTGARHGVPQGLKVEFSFEGKVSLVTGAGTGLGFAIAEALGRAGGRIAVCDLSLQKAQSACASLTKTGIECVPFGVDVREKGAVDRMIAAVEDRLGPPDIGVANAGIYPNTGFLDMDEEEWDRVIDTNLKGVFLTCQAIARSMVRAGRGGDIITMSSTSAHNAIYGWSHYAASKAGVIMLARTMALELAPRNIRVNAVLPGYIDVVEGGEHLDPGYKDAARASIPRGRPGRPEDVANAVLLLASPLADYITGTTLTVDGGSSVGRFSIRPARS